MGGTCTVTCLGGGSMVGSSTMTCALDGAGIAYALSLPCGQSYQAGFINAVYISTDGFDLVAADDLLLAD